MRTQKGDPTGRVPPLRCGATCDARAWGGAAKLALRLRRSARTTAASQSTRPGMLRCAPAPRPALLGTARGELRKTTQAIAALGLAPALLPLPLAGEGWGEGAVSLTPCGCAEARSGRGERVQRSMHPPRDLTRWRCLNPAAQPRSEFDSAPRTRAPQGAPKRMRRGRSPWGRTSFANFSCASKKSRSPAGAKPGQQRIIERCPSTGQQVLPPQPLFPPNGELAHAGAPALAGRNRIGQRLAIDHLRAA